MQLGILKREVLDLMNYYRNYHLYNELVEGSNDVYNKDINVMDDDEIAEFLIPEDQISQFWDINAEAVSMFQNYIFNWALKLSKNIRQKCRPKDPNLNENIQRLEIPPDKTATHHYEVYDKNAEPVEDEEDDN